MKKLVLIAAVLVIAKSAFAQSKVVEYASLGPVIGFGNNWVSNMPGTNKFNASGFAGASLVYAKDAHWGYGAEALLSLEGYRVADAAGNIAAANPVYLRLPLHVYYFFGDYQSLVRIKRR